MENKAIIVADTPASWRSRVEAGRGGRDPEKMNMTMGGAKSSLTKKSRESLLGGDSTEAYKDDDKEITGKNRNKKRKKDKYGMDRETAAASSHPRLQTA